MSVLFHNRAHAGRYLAAQFGPQAHPERQLLLALPRGGVPVAFEMARIFSASLDVFLVRKLGVPGHEELAFGAIASGGIRVLNPDVVVSYRLSEERMAEIARDELSELRRREQAYRQGREARPIAGQDVVLVDDGLATGATMRAAIAALRECSPHSVRVAVPVGSPETCAELSAQVDDVICGHTPEPFYSVGRWYEDFRQVTDSEVVELLDRSAEEEAAANERRH